MAPNASIYSELGRTYSPYAGLFSVSEPFMDQEDKPGNTIRIILEDWRPLSGCPGIITLTGALEWAKLMLPQLKLEMHFQLEKPSRRRPTLTARS